MFSLNNVPSSFEWILRGGPVLATAVHTGHSMRRELYPFLAISEADRLREEDPMTGIWAGIGDDVFRTATSRFEVDLNRRREKAVSKTPEDTWGLQVWNESLPPHVVQNSLREHDSFYQQMSAWCEKRVAEFGCALVFDIHSYNHARDGQGKAANPRENPDIDLGFTTFNRHRFGAVGECVRETLAGFRFEDRELDVRENIRYPDGGNFPEWLFSQYGDDVCVITLEVKKIYMNEWSGEVRLKQVYQLFEAMYAMKVRASEELLKCR